MDPISSAKLLRAMEDPDMFIYHSMKHVSKHPKSEVAKRNAAAKRHKKNKMKKTHRHG